MEIIKNAVGEIITLGVRAEEKEDYQVDIEYVVKKVFEVDGEHYMALIPTPETIIMKVEKTSEEENEEFSLTAIENVVELEIVVEEYAKQTTIEDELREIKLRVDELFEKYNSTENDDDNGENDE